jgi:hypothetical protein
MGKVYVDNRNKEHSRFCTAFDGQQTQVNPGAKRAPIDEKFTWKMHPDVSLSTGSVRAFKTADEEAADKKKAEEAEEAAIHAELEREEAEKRAKETAESEGSPRTNL